VHLKNRAFLDLDQDASREISDYVTGEGFSFKIWNFGKIQNNMTGFLIDDHPTKATIKIQPDLTQIKEITQKLIAINEITDIYRLSGDCELLIKVELPSLEHLDPLSEDKISQIPGVVVKETCIITNEVKSKY